MRVLVCGDRLWTDYFTIHKRLANIEAYRPVIVHGGANGADSLAGHAAKIMGLAVEVFPAEWDRLGKKAGPIRNRAMLDTKPDLVLAFHDDLSKSKGTRDCVDEARRRGIPVEVIASRVVSAPAGAVAERRP